MDLNKLVEEQMNELSVNGYIEKIVKAKIESTVTDIIDDTFRSYSDFGKELRTKIQDQLNLDLSNLQIPCYNEMIIREIEKSVEFNVLNGGLEKVAGTIKDLLQEIPREFNFSEILEIFKQEMFHNFDWDDVEDDSIGTTLIVVEDNSYRTKYTHIYMDMEEGREKYQCRFQLDLKEGVIYCMKIDGIKCRPNLSYSSLDKFHNLLFKIYAAGAKIVLDRGGSSSYYDTEVERPEDECMY